MDETSLLLKYQRVAQTVAQLARYERYEGAFVFGSYTAGKIHAASDLDIVVIVAGEVSNCPHINHPVIDGIRLDISFSTLTDYSRQAETMLRQGQRKPWMQDAVILFDKQNRLHEMQERVRHETQPISRAGKEADAIQFEMYYSYTKPERHLKTAPETADLIMHMELRDVLRLHYNLHGHWWVSDKHMLTDLREWDTVMCDLLQRFIQTHDTVEKYALWQSMIEHALQPIGGIDFHRQENGYHCDCSNCRIDLARLEELVE